jgi:O-antigen/teichoic acid export membrane protein
VDDPQLRAVSEAHPSSELGANADNVAVTRNALTGYAAWAVNLLIGLVVTPILLRRLGEESFGAWTLAMTVASYVLMVELGLGVATVRHLASALALGDNSRASIIASSARATYLVLACAGVAVLGVLLAFPGVLFGTGEVSAGRARVAVFILGAGYLLSLAASVYPVIAIGAGRADLGTTVGIVFRIATATAQVIVVLFSDSLVALALVTAVGVVGNTLVVRAVARRFFANIDVRLALASRGVARLLLSSGWRNAAIGVALAVAIQSDVVVVGAILGPIAVAAYGIAIRASTTAVSLATRATDVLLPTFAHATTLEERERTATAFRESVFLMRAILLPALVILAAFGQPLLELWLGDVPTDADVVLVLLVLAAVVRAPGHVSGILLIGMNRLDYMLIGTSITAIGNLGLSILLTWRLGIIGPVLGSLAGFLVWDLVLLPRRVGALLRIAWVPLAAAGLPELVLPTVAASLVAFSMALGLGWSSPGAALVGTAVVGIVYLVSVWFGLDLDRKARYRRLVVGAMSRRPHPASRST